VSQKIKSKLSSTSGLLKYYFTNNDNKDDRSAKMLLYSLLAQLCAQAKQVPPEIIAKEDRAQHTSKPININKSQTTELIIQMLHKVNTPTIIVNALNKCLNP
jgi:hypothetical protein